MDDSCSGMFSSGAGLLFAASCCALQQLAATNSVSIVNVERKYILLYINKIGKPPVAVTAQGAPPLLGFRLRLPCLGKEKLQAGRHSGTVAASSALLSEPGSRRYASSGLVPLRVTRRTSSRSEAIAPQPGIRIRQEYIESSQAICAE
jgi:hypothetical protein